MEEQDFRMAMNMMSMTGLPKLSDEQLEVWYRLLQDLTSSELEEAVMHICRTAKDFYPGTNVVALIRETAEDQRKAQRSKALRARNDAAKKENERHNLLREAEYKENPEAYRNRSKARVLAAGAGKTL